MKQHTVLFSQKMSKLPILGLMLLLCAGIQAQTNKTVADTTEVVVGNKVITITVDTLTGKKDVQVKTRDADSPDWESQYAENGDEDEDEEDNKKKKSVKPVDTDVLGIDLGFNWLMYNSSFNLPTSQSDFEIEPLRSTQVGIHVLPTHFNMAKGHVGIVSAVTFENLRYQFRNSVSLVPNQPQVTMMQDSVSLKKNKLVAWYAQIPLLLSFQTNPSHKSRNFHVAVGGFGGLFLNAYTKQKSDERGKVIRKDDYNLNPIRYGVMARIGYGKLELYSTYTLSNLFHDGQGPAFNNINFGLALTGMM